MFPKNCAGAKLSLLMSTILGWGGFVYLQVGLFERTVAVTSFGVGQSVGCYIAFGFGFSSVLLYVCTPTASLVLHT